MSILSQKNSEKKLQASLFRDDRIQEIILFKIELCIDKMTKESAKTLHFVSPLSPLLPKPRKDG